MKDQSKNNTFLLGIPFSGVEDVVKGNTIIATREDEAMGIGVGAWLCGMDVCVFMQNSGLGHCVDIMTSLMIPCGIEFDILISNRKSPEHHALMGKITMDLIDLIGYEKNKVRYC